MTELTARIAIDPQTHRKAQVLASAGVRYAGLDQISDLVRFFIDDAWQNALQAGTVKETMLVPAHWAGESTEKKKVTA